MRIIDLPLPVVIAAAAGQVIVYLMEIYPATGSPVYVATEEYNTLPTDSRPNLPFHGTLERPPWFNRSTIDGFGFWGMSSGLGDAEINNASGEYDTFITSPIDGAHVVVKQVWRAASYDRAVTIYDGLIEGSGDIDGNRVLVKFKDDNKRLEIPAQPSIYGGTGGIDGDSNAKGKKKPICLGTPPNVTLQLIDAVNLVYQGHDGQMGGWAHIYDRAIELTVNATPDYANYAALIAGTITPGRWASCNALGIIRLGAKPDGTITGTPSGGAVSNGLVAGSPTVGAALTDTASLVHYLITIAGANIVVDTGSVLSVKSAQPAPIGYFIGPDDNKTLKDAIHELMSGIDGWAGFRADRNLELGLISIPAGSPSADYTQLDWFDIERVPLPSSASPPPYRVQAAYSLNWTIQPEVDATVDASTQTLRRDAHSIATSNDAGTTAAILAAWPNAQDLGVQKTFFVNSSDAVAFCNAKLTLLGGAARSLFKLTLPFSDARLGGVIRINDTSIQPRFGLGTPKLLTVAEKDDNAEAGETVLQGFG